VIYVLILLVVDAVASPVAPWWAGPIYVASAERILIAWGQALIVAAFPVIATVIRGVKSYHEHQENLAATREAVVGRDEIRAAISENTALTIDAADASKEAAAVANDVNSKIEHTNERLLEAIRAGRQRREDTL
jgi:hypothetical protein